MTQMWAFAALDPRSRRFSGVESVVQADRIESWFQGAWSAGSGYGELHRAGVDFPALAVSVRRDACVVQAWTSPDDMLILAGDAVTDPSAVVDDFPIQDELGTFTGVYLLSVRAAGAALTQFLRSGRIDDMGRWASL